MTKRSSPVCWGVVGCGQIAVDKSIPGLLAAARSHLVAVADPLPARRELALALAGQAGCAGVRSYADARALFADPGVDAVYIALPTGDHAWAVEAAAQAGKAILCEKPLGRSAAEVAKMVAAVRRHNVPLMTGYMSRFSDVFQKAAKLVREGAIGRVTYVAADFAYPCLDPYPPGEPGGWRWTDPLGGGPLLDIGIYLAFGIREILGQRIARVWPLNCDTVAPAGSAIRDTTVAAFQTDAGTAGTFVTTFAHRASFLRFCGPKGEITLEEPFRQTPGARLICRGPDTQFVLDTIQQAGLAHFDNYRREFEHFSASLLAGETPRPSPEEVLADAVLLDALRQEISPVVVPVVGT